MVTDRSKTFNITYTLIILFTYIIIASLSFFNSGRVGYNKDVLLVYGLGAVVSLGIAFIFGALGVLKGFVSANIPFPFRFGFVSETEPLFPWTKSIALKLGVGITWALIVGFISFSGFQIWGSPDVYSSTAEFSFEGSTEALSSQEFGIARSLFDVGVMPSFTEDMVSLGLSAVIVMLLSILFWLFKVKYGTLQHAFAVFVACPIAAFTFMLAHESVGGTNVQFFFAAWLFQTINLYVMWFTAFFFPLFL